jgi:predicted amidohydrolase YtcJ
MQYTSNIAAKALLLSVLVTVRAHGAAIVVANVHGYTLAGDRLQQFTGLVLDAGKVVETGDGAALRKKFAAAKYIDGGGGTLLPGLIDAHGHVMSLGYKSARIDLDGTDSLKAAQARVQAFLKAHPGTGWVRGDGWNQVIWKLGRFPLATELDAVVADRPAALGRVDGHALWLNSRALQLAGLSKDTPDPVGGRIERDASGKPSGVLVDKAMELADKVIPEPNIAERRAALSAALAQLNAVGLTSVGDAGVSAADIAVYKSFADQDLLSVRIYAMIGDVGGDFQTWSKSGPLLGYGNDRLTVRSVKLFADGALGSRGAALSGAWLRLAGGSSRTRPSFGGASR